MPVGSIKKARAPGTGNFKTIPWQGDRNQKFAEFWWPRRVGYGHLPITKRRIVRHSIPRAMQIREGLVAI